MSNKLHILRVKIEDQFGRKNYRQWKNSDYIDLSHDIYLKTRESISPGTLKRIFGKISVPDDYLPQPGVRKVLIEYLGYDKITGWNELLGNHEFQAGGKKAKPKRYLILFLILLGIVASLIIIRTYKHSPPKDYLFEVKDDVGRAYHTAIFNYSFEEKYQGDIKIDFGEGGIAEPDLTGSTLTHYYRKPDLYRGQLLYRETVLEEFQVFVMTKGWEVYVRNPPKPYQPQRYYPIDIKYDSCFSANIQEISDAGIDTTEIFFTHYCFFDSLADVDYPVKLNIELKNDIDIREARCNHVMLNLVGDKGGINLYFLKKGCTNWSRLKFGEKEYSGSTSDLSAFGIDVYKWNNISLVIEEKQKSYQAMVKLNDKIIRKEEFHSGIGTIKGFELVFSGSGKFKNVVLNDSSIE